MLGNEIDTEIDMPVYKVYDVDRIMAGEGHDMGL